MSEGERKKDRDQVIRVPDILRAGGLTVRPEHVIGVFGDTDIDHDDDAWQSAVRNALGAEVEAARKLGRSPVVWTSLAPGAETIVAIVAKSLDYPVPYFVPLPLPIEAYHQVLRELDPDGVKELLATFRRLIAAPEAVASTARPRYVELPPRQLPLSKYGRKERHDADVVEALRQEQKLCAAAFIFERADQILFIGNIDGEITTRMRIWSGGKDLCDFERYRTPVCFAFKNPCGADGLRQVRLT